MVSLEQSPSLCRSSSHRGRTSGPSTRTNHVYVTLTLVRMLACYFTTTFPSYLTPCVCRPAVRQVRRDRKIYSGIMRITNQVFEDKYENSNSSEFKALAKQVTEQVGTSQLRSVDYDLQTPMSNMMSRLQPDIIV